MRNLYTPAARYPADPRAVFVLVGCVLTGTGTVFGATAPGSIRAQLDHGWIVAWGILIGLGGLVTLIGTFKLNDTGIIIEQIGCVGVFVATAVYAAAVWSQVGFIGPGLYAGLFQLMFGVASLWRGGQLQGIINAGIRQADHGGSA
jgi:hypothetical protein